VRIYHNQLTNTLNQGIAPVWLVFGDEPWQKNDAIEQINHAAQHAGYEERLRFTVDEKFDWSTVQQEYNALSLFASLRVIELSLSSLKIGDQGSKVLTELSETISQDTVLVLHGPKIDGPTQKRKWFKSLEKAGIFLPLYEIEGKHLQQWLRSRSQFYQLKLDNDVIQLMLTLFSGNLMALDQELQKLSILFNSQPIQLNEVEPLLINQAKFNPFQLVDTMLLGDVGKCIEQLDSLQHEGAPIAQLVWFIHKEINQLMEMKAAIASGENQNQVFQSFRIWDKKKPTYQQAINNISQENLSLALIRLADVDLISKTDTEFNPFILLADVICSLYHGEKLQALSLDYD